MATTTKKAKKARRVDITPQELVAEVEDETNESINRKFRPVVGMSYPEARQQLDDGTMPVPLLNKLVERFGCWEVRQAVKRGELSPLDAARFSCWHPEYQALYVMDMQTGHDVPTTIREALDWEQNEKARAEFEAKHGHF